MTVAKHTLVDHVYSAVRKRLERMYVPDPMSGCWLWTNRITTGGYGSFTLDGYPFPAHRASYEVFVGPIPEGMELDHLCRNRACINPDHLEPVTRRENALRGLSPVSANARKTHCPKGHAYDEANTYIWRGSRHCIACRSIVQENRTRSKALV